MIDEIVQFQESLTHNPLKDNFNPDNGFYFFISLDKDKKVSKVEKILFEAEKDLSFFKKRYREILKNSYPIHFRKTFNSGRVKIFNQVCSPFGIGFKKELLESKSEDTIEEGLRIYFDNAKEYCEEDTLKFQYTIDFETFCNNYLLSFVRKQDEYEELQVPVFIFLKDVPTPYYKETHTKYLSEKVFNKEEYNKDIKGKVFGIADNLSTFQPKKPFLRHQTAPFEYNYHIKGNRALRIFEFYQLLSEKLLPNPVPIFLNRKELNEQVISIFDEDRRLGYAEIITELINDYKEDLSNYYLVFHKKDRKGVHIIDLDFVPSFDFYIDQELRITEVFPLGNSMESKIENVFELEANVVDKIFNGQLIRSRSKGGKWCQYFNDVDFDANYFTPNGYNQFLKYRKAFYDYIYKSKRQAVTQRMFEDIVINGILEDIRQDQFQDRTTQSIKEKLNIWFSLYNFFDLTANKNLTDMPNKTEELFKKLQQIVAKDSDEIIKNDDEFAFAAGQIIYFLFSKSESSEKTHAVLEPFLQKKDTDLFKKRITDIFNAYKHNIRFNDNRFNKVMGEVIGFDPDEKSVKELMPFILAGYFKDSVFYKKQS